MSKTEKRVYRAVGYTRLSVKDGDDSVSDSIQNQVAIIRDFVDSRADLELVKIVEERIVSYLIQFNDYYPKIPRGVHFWSGGCAFLV